jgi:hypothetical protein
MTKECVAEGHDWETVYMYIATWDDPPVLNGLERWNLDL